MLVGRKEGKKSTVRAPLRLKRQRFEEGGVDASPFQAAS
jgi:hypothetical protein